MERLCDVCWNYKTTRENFIDKIREVAKERGYIKSELQEELIRFDFSDSDIACILNNFEQEV